MLKLKKFDSFLLLGLLITSLLAGYFSWRLSDSSREVNAPRVGVTLDTESHVHRKMRTDFFYQKLQDQDALYLGDQVTTGVQSSATLRLGKNTKIHLDPLSHIILDNRNNSLSIEIREGVIETTLSKSESILIDGERTTSSTAIETRLIYKKNENRSEVEVLQGEALINDGRAEKPLKKGESLTLENMSSPRTPITILAPVTQKSLAEIKPMVKVSWQAVESIDQYEIHIFENGFLKYSQKTKNIDEDISLQKFGDYQLQIVGFKGLTERARSEKISFKIEGKTQVSLRKPVTDLTLPTNQEQLGVQFEWQVENAKKLEFTLETLQEDHFEALQKTLLNDPLDFQTVNLKEGTYRWTINTQDSTPEWHEFKVIKEKLPLLPPPTMASIHRQLTPTETKQGVRLQWAPVAGAQSYEIEYDEQTLNASTNQWLSPIRSKIKTTFRLRTVNMDAVPGPWSEPINIIMSEPSQPKPPVVAATPPSPPVPTPQPTPSPTPTSEAEISSIEKPKIISPLPASSFVSRGGRFTLDVVLDALNCDNYEVEVDTRQNFSNPTILNGNSKKLRTPLNKGKYFLRARCWKDGEMGPWTNPIPISVN